ncbi:Chromosome (plasmid) partitioning protein ParB [Candidatus Burkholderia humilis]|nr:Chromosome (plasmid) partitioning protein ParB [Candidatus Burkholderia humilis]
MNMLKRLQTNTANLTPAAERNVQQDALEKKPKTGIGLVNQLSKAELRVTKAEERASTAEQRAELAEARLVELQDRGTQGEVLLSTVRPNPWQPRMVFDEDELHDLAESIKEVGLMQPVLVRRMKSAQGDEYFELIAGERRVRAHQLLGEDKINAIITHADDADMVVLALTENISRKDLSDYEISKSVRRADKEFPDRTKLAEALGLSRRGLYKFLAYANLPEFMINDLEIKPGILGCHAVDNITSVLKHRGADGILAANDLWPDVVSGRLEQGRYASAISALVDQRALAVPSGERTIDKFFAGKIQAGSIVKDVNKGITVKFKPGVISETQEVKLRRFLEEMFETETSDTE